MTDSFKKNMIMLLIIMMMMMMKSRSMASCAGHLKSINLESNQDGNIDCPLLSPRPYNPYILIYHVKRLSCWWGWLWWLMVMVMMSLLIMILIRGWRCALCKAVSDSFNLGSKFLPGFLSKISALPDFIFAFCNLCIARFRFPHSPPSPPLEGCQI